MASTSRNVSASTEEECRVINTVLTIAADCMIFALERANSWNLAEPEQIIIDHANDAYATFLFYHKVMCQKTNITKTGKIDEKAIQTGIVSIAGKDVSFALLSVGMEKIFTKYGVSYTNKKIGNVENWVTAANPYLYSIGAFAHRVKEVYMGRTRWDKDQTLNNLKDSIEHYGLNQTHYRLCEGISFPPHIKIPLLSALGPCTLMTMYVKSLSESGYKYSGKIKQALMHSIGQFPLMKTAIEELGYGSKMQSKPLMKAMADVLLWGGYKVDNIAYFPPAILIFNQIQRTISVDNEAYEPYINLLNAYNDVHVNKVKQFDPLLVRIQATANSEAVYYTKAEIDAMACEPVVLNLSTIGKLDPDVAALDFTGPGKWKLYHKLPAMLFKFKDENLASFVLTYAILGVDKENLNVIDWATGVKFPTKNELDKGFKNRKSATPVTAKPVTFKYVSKIITGSAGPTFFDVETQTYRGYVSVFSGKRKALNCVLYEEYMANQRKRRYSSGCCFGNHDIIGKLIDYLPIARDNYEKGTLGTTQWFEANALESYKNEDDGSETPAVECPINNVRSYLD